MSEISTFILAMIGESFIEIIAVICGLLNVTLIIGRSIWNYPFGILMVILYAKIFYDYKLYSDALLQVYFLAIQIYGFWYWARNRGPSGRVLVASAGGNGAGLGLAVAVLGALLLGTAMSTWTDASYPYWDASVAACSVVAQFMMSRRLIESWLFWIAVDVMAIALFWVKDLQPTAALYAIFLGLAVTGLFQWRSAWRTGEVV